MEKKKLLLVAVSVGVFLAIAISASILIFTPSYSLAAVSGRPAAVNPERPVQPVVTSPGLSGQPATVDAADMVRKAGELQGIQTPPQAQAYQENYFYINGEAPSDSYQVEKTGDNAAARVVINVPRPSTAAVPDAPMEKPVPVAKPVALKTALPAAKPVTAPKPASKPVAAKPAPQTYNSYWVQTGAFSGKDRAEGAQETLSSKGISSIIDDRNVDGKTFYRVRVGPYTSENEAKYWLSLVKTIDGFSESQIRTTKAAKN
jgi:DedD protein